MNKALAKEALDLAVQVNQVTMKATERYQSAPENVLLTPAAGAELFQQIQNVSAAVGKLAQAILEE